MDILISGYQIFYFRSFRLDILQTKKLSVSTVLTVKNFIRKIHYSKLSHDQRAPGSKPGKNMES